MAPAWTLNQLRTFCSVVETGTMRAAAKRLGYTVGAISQQMASLQVESKATLFLKDGRGQVLTDAGQLLFRHARTILAAEEAAAESMASRGPNIDAVVRLGVFGSVASAVARPVFERLRLTHPHVQITVHEVDVENMALAVDCGEIDLALGLDYSDVPLPQLKGLVRTHVLDEPFCVVLPAGYVEFDGHEKGFSDAVSMAGKDLGWILPPARTIFGRAARMACVRSGITVVEKHVVTDTALAIALVGGGIGITVATPLMLDFHRGDTVAVPLLSGATREVVTLAKTAVLQRSSVSAVNQTLQTVLSLR